MGRLDNLCRFCAQELDRSSSKNIFYRENLHLLQAASFFIPRTISGTDRYPKLTCIHCEFKLNVITEFQNMISAASKIFDEILSRPESVPEDSDQNRGIIKFEAVEFNEIPSRAESIPEDCKQNEIIEIEVEDVEYDQESKFHVIETSLYAETSEIHEIDNAAMSDEHETSSELKTEAEAIAQSHLLPKNSKSVYEKAYSQFLAWKAEKSIGGNEPLKTTESLLLTYFRELSQTKKVSSLWATYSMLKSTIHLNEGINLASFPKIKPLIKTTGEGYVPTKASVFTGAEIKKFLEEAPDYFFLDMKVTAIMGVCGACRKTELLKMEINHLKMASENMMVVSIPVKKNEKPRSFVIEEPTMINIVKKYLNLRPETVTNSRFFLNYRNGKCTRQVIGKNKLAKVPQEIAKFLGLPNPTTYTGHSFRRTSASLLADGMMVLTRHGGWASDTVAEGNVAGKTTSEVNMASQKASNFLERYPIGPKQISRHNTNTEPAPIILNFSNNDDVNITLNM